MMYEYQFKEMLELVDLFDNESRRVFKVIREQIPELKDCYFNVTVDKFSDEVNVDYTLINEEEDELIEDTFKFPICLLWASDKEIAEWATAPTDITIDDAIEVNIKVANDASLEQDATPFRQVAEWLTELKELREKVKE